MGVRGLTTFIDAHPYIHKPYKLHDMKVVVDGNNLLHFLYSLYEIDCACGGDYNRYAAKVKKYLSLYIECNIKLFIVFDGGHDKSESSHQKQLKRWRKRLARVDLASETGRCKESFLPINTSETFRLILIEMGIDFVQNSFESDNEVAALANAYECPVLSDDSDFNIYDLKAGYIRLSSIDERVTTINHPNGAKSKYIKCVIYHRDTFLSYFSLIDRNILPLFATLAGNDYLSYDHLKPFMCNLQYPPGQRLASILSWLSSYKCDMAIEQVLKCIHEEQREEFKLLLGQSVDSYKLISSNLIHLFQNKTTVFQRGSLSNTKLVTLCGAHLPKQFTSAFSQGRIPGYFLNILNQHRLFLSVQVQDISYCSSFDCSRFIRQILFGLLLQHNTTNTDYHNTECLCDVEEYDRSEYNELHLKIKPIYCLTNGQLLPKLHEIYHLPKKHLCEIIANVIGVDISFLKSIPSNLQLLFGCIHYWLINSFPKPTKEFAVSLILCILYFNVLCEPILKASILSSKNNNSKLHTILSALERISISEQSFVAKQLGAYLHKPYFTHKPLNVSIVHSYSQFQTCFLYLESLNKLFNFPFEPPKLYEVVEGTMLYNLTDELLTAPSSAALVQQLLGGASMCSKLLNILLSRAIKFLPADFFWAERKNSNRDSLQAAAKLVNKFENLCTLKDD